MSETTTRPEPHEFVPAQPGTRDAEFGWCAVEGCGWGAEAYIHASAEDRAAFDSGEGQRDASKLAEDREWFGYLTTANYTAIAERIRRMLTGKRYTWVDADAMGGYRPGIRTGMKAEEITGKLLNGTGRPLADVCVHDSYGLWAIHSHFASQHEARKADPKRRTYVHFEQDRWGDRLQIEHYAISGNHLWWTIAVEGSGW